MVFRGVVVAATAAAALVLAGCSAVGGDGGDGGRPEVAAAFYPLAFVAERVAGDHADVVNLTSPGGEPHDLELSFNQTVTLAGADLVLLLHGFQPAVDEAAATTAEGEVLDAGSVVGLQPLAGTTQPDPHFWQDPTRVATLAGAVADRLAAIDPAHATSYHQNAERLQGQLAELDEAYRTGLADCARDTIVVSHDAFGYLGRYGLSVEAITGLSPDAEPSPGDLARLARLVDDQGITTVFSETLASPRLAQTLAEETGVRTAVLDPIEGLSDATADQDYLSLMRANLTALKEANQCQQ